MQSTYTSFLNNYLIQKQTSATVHKTNPLPLRKNLLNRCYICCGKDAIRLSVTKPSRSSAFFQLSFSCYESLRELSAEDLLEFHSCVSWIVYFSYLFAFYGAYFLLRKLSRPNAQEMFSYVSGHERIFRVFDSFSCRMFMFLHACVKRFRWWVKVLRL